MSTFNKVEWNSGRKDYGMAYDASDDGLIVNFYMKSVRDQLETRKQGIPIFNDVVFVKIFRAGELLNVIDRPKEENDERRFARQWNNFQDRKIQVPEGTPIDLLFPNNPGIADSLRARGVYTIQQCANLTAHGMDGIGMGAQEYVNRAKKFLEMAGSGSNVVKMQEELAEKDKQIAFLKRQSDEMIESMRLLQAQMMQLQMSTVNQATGMPAQPRNVSGIDIQDAMIKDKNPQRK